MTRQQHKPTTSTSSSASYIHSRVLRLRRQRHLTTRQIAEELDTNQTRVSRCLKKKRNDKRNQQQYNKAGRRLLLTQQEIHQLDQFIHDNRKMKAESLKTIIFDKFHKDISTSSIKRYRRNLGYKLLPDKITLKNSQLNILYRHVFAQNHKNYDVLKWIYQDETVIQLRNCNSLSFYKPGEERDTHEISGLRAYVMVCAILCVDIFFFQIYKKYLNKERTKEMHCRAT